jgi:hypothetical protein
MKIKKAKKMTKSKKHADKIRLRQTRFNNIQLAVFAVAFALIGFFVWKSFAYTTNEVALNGLNSSSTSVCSGWTASTPSLSNTATPTFEIAGNGNRATYEAFLDGTDIGAYGVSDLPFADVCVPTPAQFALSSGPHSFYAREINPTAGELTTPNPLTFTVDTIPPSTPPAPSMASFSDSGVAGDAITKFGNPSFLGTADPNTSILLYINGQAGFGGAGVDGTSNWSARIISQPTGTYTLTVVASDQAGNLSPQSAPLTFKIDTVAPTSPSLLPANGASVSGTVNLSATATDTDSGIWKVDFQVDGVTKATDSSAPYSYSWNTTGLTDGSSHSLTAIIHDVADNTTTTSSTVTVQSGSGSPVPGDVNGDGHVNITDLSVLLSNWQTNNANCDLNHNGIVDIFDLSILLSHYGS